MEADWYADPLGRFEGRFFDGSDWTERVSNGGTTAVDPDFPPTASDAPAEPAGLSESSNAPAVVPVAPTVRRKASLMEESPVRTVAVLDSSLVDSSLVDKALVDNEQSATGERPTRNMKPIIWALLGLIAALVVAGLLVRDRDQTVVVVEPVELDQAEEARVQDLAEGGAAEVGDIEQTQELEELEVDAPPGAVNPDTNFDASETIEVGGLQILNGVSMLDDLAAWHQDFAAERGVQLDPMAHCWFGQLGGAAVQVAQCGPVGGTADTEFLFDSVPLLFEETNGGQIAQPVIDAAMTDTVLANALTLVGTPGTPSPLEGSDG